MSVGHMRREGFRLGPGRFIWSNPPRYRPMMKVLDISKTCSTDLLAARCSAVQMEAHYGIDDHPNCQDTLGEAIGEFGLTPDDTHDSLNFWQNTKYDHIGYYNNLEHRPPRRSRRPAGDHGCAGRADRLRLGQFLGDQQLLLQADQDRNLRGHQADHGAGGEGMEADVFAQDAADARELQEHPVLRTEPALKRDPTYVPDYVNFPIEWKEIEVTFTNEEYQSFWHLRGMMGDTDDELVRTMFFHWYLDNRKKLGWRDSAHQHA